jgi:ParB family transcriptional regulator, chromosome partitioning protein
VKLFHVEQFRFLSTIQDSRPNCSTWNNLNNLNNQERTMAATAVDTKRRALGKGLDSLLPRVQAEAPAAQNPAAPAAGEATGKPLEIPVEKIDRNPYQTRTHFDEKLLAELAASIAATGVIQPILVRPLPGGRYQLIAGERRWLASQKAGKATVPAVVQNVSDSTAMEITIIENLQRADLNPIEQARAYERLGREFGMTQEQMAHRTGKERGSIANFLRMLKLPEGVQDKVASGVLSFGHAKVLLGLEHSDDVERAVKNILTLSLNVRQTETMVQNILFPDRQAKEEVKKPAVDPNVREAQERLQRALGLRVRIEDKHGRGRVIIEYGRLEDFDAIVDRVCDRD